jgi:uncharacterized protein involved in exopolysaccharide biosynthesis
MDRIEETQQGTLRDLLYVLFKHKSRILIIFFSIVVTVTVGSFIMDPTYEATSKILVKFGRENVYATTTQTASGSGQIAFDTGREERINSEVELLKGQALISKVIADIGVKNIYPSSDTGFLKPILDTLRRSLGRKELAATDRAILLLQKKLEVEAVKKSDIITVKFQHKDPVMAARVVNKLIDRFTEYHVVVHQQPQSYGFFDEQVKLKSEELKNSEKEFQTYRTTTDVAALKEQRELLLKQISEIEMNLAKTRGEISENEGRLIALKTGQSGSESAQYGQETELNPYSASNPRLKLAQLKSKEHDLLINYKETNWQVVAIRQEIAETEQFLAKQEQTYHEKALLTITQTLKALRGKEGSLNRDRAKYVKELARINSTEMRLTELERNLKVNEENYQLYVKKMEEARVSNAMDKEQMVNISTAEPALPPVKPVKPKILLNIILSIVLGAFSGLGAAFFSEYLSHTFNNPEDVERRLGLPMLASMTRLRP